MVGPDQQPTGVALRTRRVGVAVELAAAADGLHPRTGDGGIAGTRCTRADAAAERGIAQVAAAFHQRHRRGGMQFTAQGIQCRADLGREQLGQRLGQALVDAQAVRTGGHAQLVGGYRRAGQCVAAGHVDLHAVGAVAQVELQERRERGEVHGGEGAVDAAVGLQEVELLTQVVDAHFRQCLQGAVQAGGAGHVQLVAAAARGQFGQVGAAGGLHVVAVDGQGADRVARRDDAFHAGVAETADTLQRALGTDQGAATGLHAVERDHAAADGQVGVVEHAAGGDAAGAGDVVEAHVAQGAVEQDLAAGDIQRGRQCIDAVQFQHALTHDGAVEGVVTAQAQPADAGLGQLARAADVVGPVVPCIAFPHLQATGLLVHHHVGVHAQLAVAFDGLGQVHQAPAVDIVHALGTEIGGGGQQHIAHLRVVQVREAFEQQAERAGDVRGRHRGAAQVLVAVGRRLAVDVDDQVAVVVVEVGVDLRIGTVYGGRDGRARRGKAPVGRQAAAHGTVAQFEFLVDVDDRQPVRLKVGDRARQRRVDACNRCFFGRGVERVGITGRPHLDQATAARPFGHRGELILEHRVGLVEIQILGRVRLGGQAPAVVDRAYALRVERGVQLPEDRIVGAQACDGLRIQIEIAIDFDDAHVAGRVGEQPCHAQVGAKRHTVRAVAIAVGRDGAGHVGPVDVVAGTFINMIALEDVSVLGIQDLIVDRHLVAVTDEAGIRTVEHFTGAQAAVTEHIGQMDAAMVLAGEFIVFQAGTTIEHAQADALAGQAARIGSVGIDGLQAPVGLELVGAPAFSIAGVAQYRGAGLGGWTHRRDDAGGHIDPGSVQVVGGALDLALLLVGIQYIVGLGDARQCEGGQQGAGDGRRQHAARGLAGRSGVTLFH